MHRTIGLVSALGMLASACMPGVEGQDQCWDVNYELSQPVGVSSETTPWEALDALVAAEIDDQDIPGCVVGVVDEDEIIYLKGYGLAHIGEGRAFDYKTPTAIASLSKTLTAIAMLKLVELEKANVTDSINTHLGDAGSGDWDDVTIHQLLTHTGGFATELVFEDDARTEALFRQNYDDTYDHPGLYPALLVAAYANGTESDLGENAAGTYSNAGYTLLGAIIDSLVADNAGELGATNYEGFSWLEMPDLGYTLCQNEYWRQDDIPMLAMGYSGQGPQQPLVERPAHFDGLNSKGQPTGGPAGWQGPSGGWTLTIGDLMRILIGLNTQANMSETLWDQMMTAHSTVAGASYGYGVFVSGGGSSGSDPNLPQEGIDAPLTYWHSGEIAGYTAFYRAQPEGGRAVAALCNHEEAQPGVLVSKIEQFVWDEAP